MPSARSTSDERRRRPLQRMSARSVSPSPLPVAGDYRLRQAFPKRAGETVTFGCPPRVSFLPGRRPPKTPEQGIRERAPPRREGRRRALGVPESWVPESARTEAIPHVGLGRSIRFDLGDVERWLEECECPGRPIALRRNVA